jgi:hypothetical protein
MFQPEIEKTLRNEKESFFENMEDNHSSEEVCLSSDDEYELPLRPFNRYKGVIHDKVHHFFPPREIEKLMSSCLCKDTDI